ncbi:MAG: NADH-quinone oxidoreductase subunit C [Peptococcaceae bacterium]|nr:NADH-quinone oxidoreductase subunit C [Peptococcaceae bacterium]
MFERLETKSVDKAGLVEKAKELRQDSYRLIQLHCVKTVTEMFLIYSFEKMDYEVVHYRMDVTEGETLPSISSVYTHACLYENETNELFGLNISGMAIDFKGTFYETAKNHAFTDIVNPQDKKVSKS